MALLSSPVGRLSDAWFRVSRWRRQQRLRDQNPLQLEPHVAPHAKELGFFHLYTAGTVGETSDWLSSPAYASEAAKRDPIDLCHFAMDRFHAFLERGDAGALGHFMTLVDGLIARGQRFDVDGRACFVIPHRDRIEGYGAHATPWLNAAVQGWCGALFVRMYQQTGDAQYAVAARHAINACFVAVDRGGVRARERHGRVFYEKYALPGQSRHILNGFLGALLGIWDVARGLDDDGAHAAFADGLASLDDTVLASFDNGHISLYDQSPDTRATPSCVFYNWVHVRQLAALSRVTRDARLRQWAERWNGYASQPEHRAVTAFECLGYRARSLPRYLGLEAR